MERILILKSVIAAGLGGAMLGSIAAHAEPNPSPPRTAQHVYTVTMPDAAWTIVAQGLVQLPYKDAAPVIAELIKQTQAQDKPATQPAPKK